MFPPHSVLVLPDLVDWKKHGEHLELLLIIMRQVDFHSTLCCCSCNKFDRLSLSLSAHWMHCNGMEWIRLIKRWGLAKLTSFDRSYSIREIWLILRWTFSPVVGLLASINGHKNFPLIKPLFLHHLKFKHRERERKKRIVTESANMRDSNFPYKLCPRTRFTRNVPLKGTKIRSRIDLRSLKTELRILSESS